MTHLTLVCSFEYAYAVLLPRLPAPPPGRCWCVCAHYPDARLKHIWLGAPDPLGY